VAEVVHFTPRSELEASANVRDFIEVCRTKLTAFGAALCFDDNVWDVTEALGLKRSKSLPPLSAWPQTDKIDRNPYSGTACGGGGALRKRFSA